MLDETRAAGLSVLRTWAFCDGAEWNALQPAPGEWDERVFAALDWVVAQTSARGLRLVLALTNYWAAYGGIKQYVRRAHALCLCACYGRQESRLCRHALVHTGLPLAAYVTGLSQVSRRLDLATVLSQQCRAASYVQPWGHARQPTRMRLVCAGHVSHVSIRQEGKSHTALCLATSAYRQYCLASISDCGCCAGGAAKGGAWKSQTAPRTSMVIRTARHARQIANGARRSLKNDHILWL